MKTFLSQIPQSVDFDSLMELDPGLATAIRDVANAHGMPATLGTSALLESLAAVRTAQMLHDGEDKDAFTKGVISGLLVGAALPGLCQSFVKQAKPKEGPPQ